MDWTHRHIQPKVGIAGKTVESPHGPLTFKPKPPRPARDIFTAAIEFEDWGQIQNELIGYWVKLCETLPRYYTEADPGKPWDRLTCLIDVVYGRVTSHLRHSDPHLVSHLRHADPNLFLDDLVTVIVDLPCVERTLAAAEEGGSLGKRRKHTSKELKDRIVAALAGTARTEPAKSMLRELCGRYGCRLFTMTYADEDSQKPLPPP